MLERLKAQCHRSSLLAHSLQIAPEKCLVCCFSWSCLQPERGDDIKGGQTQGWHEYGLAYRRPIVSVFYRCPALSMLRCSAIRMTCDLHQNVPSSCWRTDQKEESVSYTLSSLLMHWIASLNFICKNEDMVVCMECSLSRPLVFKSRYKFSMAVQRLLETHLDSKEDSAMKFMRGREAHLAVTHSLTILNHRRGYLSTHVTE